MPSRLSWMSSPRRKRRASHAPRSRLAAGDAARIAAAAGDLPLVIAQAAAWAVRDRHGRALYIERLETHRSVPWAWASPSVRGTPVVATLELVPRPAQGALARGVRLLQIWRSAHLSRSPCPCFTGAS